MYMQCYEDYSQPRQVGVRRDTWIEILIPHSRACNKSSTSTSTNIIANASLEKNLSLFYERCPRSVSLITPHPSSSNTTKILDVLARSGYNDEITLAGPPNEEIAHTAYKKQYDLLGLTPPTTHEYLPDEDMACSDSSLQRAHDEKIAACPVHGALLTKFHTERDIVSEVAREPQSTLTPLPMDRYLAEGLDERYALLNINHPGRGGEWARYSACICEKWNASRRTFWRLERTGR